MEMFMLNAQEQELSQRKNFSISDYINTLLNVTSQYGININGYNRISLNKFNALPIKNQNTITNIVKYCSDLVYTVIDINKNIDEVKMVKTACADLNLEIPDEFLKRIRKGDVVEVYETETMIQIYRNFEFLKHCSYDLLTVCLTPLNELFEREEGADEIVFQRAREICDSDIICERWNVPDHTLVEKLEKHNRVFKLKLGFIAPVTHKITGKKMAWASTLRVERLGSLYEDLGNVSPL
jgi:hypothetical protein